MADETKETRRKQIIELARETYPEGKGGYSDGDINIDDDAILSESDENGENGCYVAAWVWVRFDGTPFDKETKNRAARPSQ